MTTVAKTTVRLDEDGAEHVAKYKMRTVEADAFKALTGIDATSAKLGTILNALIEVGIAATDQRAEELRYRRLAEHLANDFEAQAWRNSRRTRTARRTERTEDQTA